MREQEDQTDIRAMAAPSNSSLTDDWVNAVDPDPPIDAAWLLAVLPSKSSEKRASWLASLHAAEFEAISELAQLDDDGWQTLGLPLAIQLALKTAVQSSTTSSAPTLIPSSVVETPLAEVDVVVLDISRSMRARSHMDPDKTREDVSKLLFHLIVDKMVGFELHHAVGLVTVGHTNDTIPVTTHYESFHDELGRLDADQPRTRLFDGLQVAADMLDDYVREHDQSTAVKRIFVLTDGADNASELLPWQVAQTLQQRGIICDCVPLATDATSLRAICTSTGGLCFDVQDEAQSSRLFESEATVSLAAREVSQPCSQITDAASFSLLSSSTMAAAPVHDLRAAPPKAAFAAVVSPTEVAKQCNSSASGSGSASLRRVLKEFQKLQQEPQEGWQLYMTEDAMSWKAVLSGLPAPYENGRWLVTLTFPSDFPFKPPRVQFVTGVYHCNISQDGKLCLPLLMDQWSAAFSVSRVLKSISELLLNPNPDNPLEAWKGEMCRVDLDKYNTEAAQHTLQHANQTMRQLAEQYQLPIPDDEPPQAPDEPPHSFLCCISHSMMQDPVVDPEGNSYEKAAIIQWLQQSQNSPIARTPLTASQLVPNRALAASIVEYRARVGG